MRYINRRFTYLLTYLLTYTTFHCNVYKLSVEFAVFVDFELDKAITNPLASRHEILVDLHAVKTKQTERRSQTQQGQLRGQVIIRRYLLLQHIIITYHGTIIKE